MNTDNITTTAGAYTRAGFGNYTSEQLAEVLQPREYTGPVYRNIKPAVCQPGSFQDSILTRAAGSVRELYRTGMRHVPYNKENPEAFFTACGDTWALSLNVTQDILDEAEAAIALAILDRAGWRGNSLKPTTLQAQAAIKACVIKAAHDLRFQFSQQQELV
jgi:hypothetical protein